MSYEPLHHKYRPQTFAELVGQEAIASTLTNAITSGRIAPAYLFSGPRGTGKTSSARILAKSLNCVAGDGPTPTPCGRCEVCSSITKGSSLDVVEIDAASNTGVDNIREMIERAQFAPVQCRYKVYAIDECLAGDSLVLTEKGLMRIDNPQIEGKRVLSYNESSETWEFKPVLRWLDRGEKETSILKTNKREIRCTSNHLLRTETGWVAAGELQVGMNLFSPAPATARDYFLQRLWQFTQLVGYRMLSLANQREQLTALEALNAQRIEPKWQTKFETILAVEPGETTRVYDLEVADNHNFVANGLLVHNCHMLSVPAFNALLKTLEEPPPRVVFVLATTDPQRVLTTIISRCQRFDFRRIPLEAMVSHLKTIALKEKIEITEEAVTVVAQIANGGLRDAESLLDQLSLSSETVTIDRVWELVGAVPERDLLALLRAIAQGNAPAVIEQCRQLMDRGREPLTVLQSLAGFYLNLLVAKTSPQRQDLVAVTAATWQELCQEARSWETSWILGGQQHLKESEGQIKNSTQPRLWLEVTLLGLLPKAIAPQPTAASSNGRTAVVQSPPHSSENSEQKTVVQSSPQTSGNGAKKDVPPPNPPTVPEKVPETTPSPKASPPAACSPEQLHQERVEKIWQRVLEQIQPNATQSLVNQHCQLLNFDVEESIAEVGITSKNLLGMAQEKIANIEAAFERVWQQRVKVNLRVGTSPSPSAKVSSSPEPKSSNNHDGTSPVQPTAREAIAKPSNSHQNGATASTAPPVRALTPTEPKPPENGNGHQPAIAPTVNPPSSRDESEENVTEDEISQAAQHLAQLFDGEEIALDRDFFADSEYSLNSDAIVAAEEPQPPSVPEPEEEEDDDIPF